MAENLIYLYNFYQLLFKPINLKSFVFNRKNLIKINILIYLHDFLINRFYCITIATTLNKDEI